MSDDKTKELFDAQDSNGTGELSVEQFGAALYEGIKDMTFDADGGEE